MFEKAQELGVNLIGVHKGVPLGPQPIEHTQTWDMDGAAANFPDINFVIFHVGLPFLDETCWQLIRYPNLYASDRGHHQLRGPGAADVRRDHREAAVLVRGRQDRLRVRGAAVPPAVGATGVHGLPDPRGSVRGLRLPAADRAGQAQDPRARTCSGCTAWTSRRPGRDSGRPASCSWRLQARWRGRAFRRREGTGLRACERDRPAGRHGARARGAGRSGHAGGSGHPVGTPAPGPHGHVDPVDAGEPLLEGGLGLSSAAARSSGLAVMTPL